MSRYAPGVMQRTIAVRQAHLTAYDLPVPLPPTDGYMAVRECYDIGKIFTVSRGNIQWRVLATDCGSPSARWWMYNNNIVGEVDHELAIKMGMGRLAGPNTTICSDIDYEPMYGRMK